VKSIELEEWSQVGRGRNAVGACWEKRKRERRVQGEEKKRGMQVLGSVLTVKSTTL
jgi:hypothetical protein